MTVSMTVKGTTTMKTEAEIKAMKPDMKWSNDSLLRLELDMVNFDHKASKA